MKVKSIVIALTAALAASASVQSYAAFQPAAEPAQVLTAREASEGQPGNDRERQGDRQRRGAQAQDESHMQLAREASEAPRGNDRERQGDRQSRGGRS